MLTLFLDWRVQLSHRRGHGTALCALAVATGLVLTGCGTESEPVPTTTPTSTETAPSTPEPSKSVDTPEPTTTEPTPEPIPPDPAQLINENTEEGAKSAANYFLRLQNHVLVSDEEDLWRAKTSSDCQFCNDTIQRLLQLHEEDLKLLGGEILVKETNFIEEKWPNVWVVELLVSEEPITLQRASGETVSVLEGSSELIQVVMSFNDGTWLLEELTN